MALGSRAKRFAVIVVLLLLGIVGVTVLLSIPSTQTRLVGWAFGALDTRFGIVGHAERVDLDLSRLDVRLRGLTLAVRNHADEPFFTAEEARIDLPWSALWDELSIQSVELVRPRLSVRIAADTSSNLPTVVDTGPASNRTVTRLPIAAFDLRDLTVDWHDDARDVRVAIGPTSATLTGSETMIHGSVRLGGDASIQVRGEQIVVTRAEGQLSYDGTSIGLEAFTLEAAEGTVAASGHVRDLFAHATLDIAVDAEADLASITERAPALGVAGRVVLSVRVEGPVRNPTARATLAVPALQWFDLMLTDVQAALRVTFLDALIEELTFHVATGDVSASGNLALTEAGESALLVEWRDVDADALRRALPGRVPSQFDAAMSGDVDIAWTRFAPTSVTMRGRSRTIGGGGTGEMELVAHDGLWQVDLDQPLTSAARVTGVIEGRARADGWAEVELDGALHLTCTDLGRCRAVLAPAASSADTDLLTGSLAAEVRVNGTLGHPRLTGSVAVADVGVGALSGIQLEANVSADLTTLDVASAVGRLGNNVIRGRVRVVWDGGLIDGAIDGELRDLTLLTPMLPAEWAPRGMVRVDAAIAGSVSSPSFDRITLTGNQLVLTPLFAGTPDEIPIAGRVNLEFEGSGPMAAPVGTATLEATDLAWNDYRLGTARATIAVDGGTVHGQAELPEFSAVAEIALDLADRRTIDLIVDVANADLARVAADTAVPLAGTASLGAHVTYAFGESGGSAAAERVTVDIQLRSIEGSVGDTPVRLVQPADLRYLPTDISTDHVELTVSGTRVTLSGRLADGRADILTARALGRVQDLTPLLTQIPGVAEWTGELDLAGTFQLEVVVAGSPSAPLLSGDLSLDNGRVGFGDHPPVDRLTLQAVCRDGAVRLEQLSGSWQRASLFATGVLPASLFADHLPPLIADVLPAGGPATLRAEINGITSAALFGYVEESTRMQFEGAMRATVDIQADDARLDAIRGALTLPEAAVTIAGIPLAQRRETRVELANGRVRIATFDWGNDDDYVTLGGTVSVGDDAVADLTVTAEIDLRALSAFLPAAVEGNALLIANIAGPIATPEITCRFNRSMQQFPLV